MNYRQWILTTERLLQAMQQIDFGYPLGANIISAPQPPAVVDSIFATMGATQLEPLREFYNYCDGLSLPDVRNGYFLKSVNKLLTRRLDSEPVEVQGQLQGQVYTFGSSGGGDLFALRLTEGDVLHLPPGPIEAGCYNGTNVTIRQLAGSFPEFLSLLLDDIEAFVEDKPHRYLV